MKKLYLLCMLFACTSVYAEELSIAEKFNRITGLMEEVVHAKVVPSYAQKFSEDIAYARKKFTKLETLFLSKIFIHKTIKNKKVHDTKVRKFFNDICITIMTIDQQVKTAKDLRPRHIFWLIEDVTKLDVLVRVMFHKIKDEQELVVLKKILRFTIKMTEEVCPFLYMYIGNKPQYVHDYIIYKVLKKYWWMLPIFAVAAVGVGVGCSYKNENLKQINDGLPTWLKPLFSVFVAPLAMLMRNPRAYCCSSCFKGS